MLTQSDGSDIRMFFLNDLKWDNGETMGKKELLSIGLSINFKNIPNKNLDAYLCSNHTMNLCFSYKGWQFFSFNGAVISAAIFQNGCQSLRVGIYLFAKFIFIPLLETRS